MVTHVSMLDSRLFRDQFGTPEMRRIFSDGEMISCWAAAEAALARAQSDLGLVPAAAADEITQLAESFEVRDYQPLRDRLRSSGHPLIPFLDEFAARLPESAAGWLHAGATTQDITDTGFVLMLRDGLADIRAGVDALTGVLCTLAERYRSTPMSGRTHGQHAVPITFGLKIAVMIDEVLRHRERLREIEPRVLVGQLGGAAGTQASFGDRGPELLAGFCHELGLGVPTAPWHSARDRFAEVSCTIAMIAATCGRMAREVIDLQRTEIAEVAEPSTTASVGSSTMPQKQNPMVAEVVLAVTRPVRQQPAVMIDAMGSAHERDMSTWAAEWLSLTESAILTSAALHQIREIYAGLEVDEARMALNLRMSMGSINAEQVMMRLAPSLGKGTAHHVVTAALRNAEHTGQTFEEALNQDEAVAAILTPKDIASALEPGGYLGSATTVVDGVLARAGLALS